MRETMTYVGLDVHARSTHAAALDVLTGELRRARFGGGSEEVIGWLAGLPQPLRGCYEAGPTGFALYRAAEAARADSGGDRAVEDATRGGRPDQD